MGASFSLCIPPPASVKQEEKELDELLDFLHLKMEKRLSIGVAYSSSMVTGLSEERKRLVLLFHWKNQAEECALEEAKAKLEPEYNFSFAF